MEKVTLPVLLKKTIQKEPIVALTCYDAATAKLIDPVVDIALVGDSLANTRLGYPNTLPITLGEMIHHAKASARGIRHAMLVGDMPFQSYEAAPWQAAVAAGRFVKEGGVQAVKVEGGKRIAKSVEAILKSNVPVMGHLGLTPQSVHLKGGYFVQGKTAQDQKDLLDDAMLLESLGAFAIVLEGIPSSVAKKISQRLKIPTIGIGAGPYCDGQILVLDDVLGMTEGHSPKFVKRYANLHLTMKKAVNEYRKEVVTHRFPSSEYSY